MRRDVKTWRGLTVLALALAIAAPPATGPATAAPSDGAPTPEACAPFGFRTAENRPFNAIPSGVWRGAAGQVAAKAARDATRAGPRSAPPPPSGRPPPPPLSIPPVPAPVRQGEASAVTVTGSARRPPVVSDRYAPPAPDRERYPEAASNPVKQVASDPVSTFSTDVDTASYARVRRLLNDGQRPPTDAVRTEELVNYFDYAYPRPATAAEAFRPYVAVTPSPWNPGRQVIHIGLQGFAPQVQPPLNLVFLVDTSGSMSPADRLPLAVRALNVLIDGLRPQDRVSLAVYAGSAGEIVGPTSGAEKLKLRCALQSLGAGGSTAGGAGLQLAYALAARAKRAGDVSRVVLMTDGDFNVGLSDPRQLKDFVADKRKTGVYLSIYGFGIGNYQDATLQALAQAGNGTAGYVDGLSEARKLFRTDFNREIFPLADDVKIQVEFNPATVREYRLIGYETRLLNREDFNNDRVDAGEVGAGASVTALYEISPVGGPASVDPLRYSGGPAPAPGRSGELAFLRIRYKAPGGQTSRLIDRPITLADAAPSLAAAPERTRWALAVAGYGQLLRRDPHLAERFGWGEVRSLAEGARGSDPLALKAEFVELTREAEHAVPRS